MKDKSEIVDNWLPRRHLAHADTGSYIPVGAEQRLHAVRAARVLRLDGGPATPAAGSLPAGAVVAAKTNVPDMGAGANTRNPVWGATGNPFDLALSGDGFFAVETPRGERYTRAGRFVLAADLVNDLVAGQARNTLHRRLLAWTSPDTSA